MVYYGKKGKFFFHVNENGKKELEAMEICQESRSSNPAPVPACNHAKQLFQKLLFKVKCLRFLTPGR